MLNPFYMQPPPGLEKEVDLSTYQVVSYAQIDRYVLLNWKVKLLTPVFSRITQSPVYSMEGQSLWAGQKRLFTHEGKTALIKPRQKIPDKGSPRRSYSNWLEDAAKDGQAYYGLPNAIALKLEDPSSLRYP